MKRRTVKKALLVLALIFGYQLARAETTYHDATPANKVSAREASRLMDKDQPIFKCRRVVEGPNINLVVDHKAPTTWHTSVGKDLGEAALERVAGAKPLVRCQEVYKDKDTMRVRNAN